MGFLIRKLLPYALAGFGMIMVIVTSPIVFGGAETEPTTIGFADVKQGGDQPEWLTVSGGGAYLPDVMAYTEVNEDTNEQRVKAFYVPVMSRQDAQARLATELFGGTPPPPEKAIFVRFDKDAFEQRFPNLEELVESKPFQPYEPTGTINSDMLVPGRVKDYIKTEWKMPLESVIVLKEGDKPLQQGPATVGLVFGLMIMAAGGFWVYRRFTGSRRAQPGYGDYPSES